MKIKKNFFIYLLSSFLSFSVFGQDWGIECSGLKNQRLRVLIEDSRVSLVAYSLAECPDCDPNWPVTQQNYKTPFQQHDSTVYTRWEWNSALLAHKRTIDFTLPDYVLLPPETPETPIRIFFLDIQLVSQSFYRIGHRKLTSLRDSQSLRLTCCASYALRAVP